MLPPTHLFILPDELVVRQRGRTDPLQILGRLAVPLSVLPRSQGDPIWGYQAIEHKNAGDPDVIVNPLLEMGDGVARPPGEDRATLLRPAFRAVVEALRLSGSGSDTSLPVRLHLHPAVPAHARPVLEQAFTDLGLEVQPTASLHEVMVTGARDKGDVSKGRRVLVLDAGFGNLHLSIVSADKPVKTVTSAVLAGVAVDDRAEMLAEMMILRAVGHQVHLEGSDLRAAVARFVPRARALLKDQDATGAPLCAEIMYQGRFMGLAQIRPDELDARRASMRHDLFAKLKAALSGQAFDEVRIVSPILGTASMQDWLESYLGQPGRVHPSWDVLLELAVIGDEGYVAPQQTEPGIAPPPIPPPPTPPPSRFDSGQRTGPLTGNAWTPRPEPPSIQPPAVGDLSRGVVESLTSRRTTIKLSSGAMVVFEGYSVSLPGGGVHVLHLEENVEVRVLRHDPDGAARVEVLPPLSKSRASEAVPIDALAQAGRSLDSVPALRVLPRHSGPVWSVAISPDGTRVLSGGDDRKVQLHDIASGTKVGTPLEPEKPVFALAWSPNGGLLLVASGDSPRLWNFSSRTYNSLNGHRTSVLAVAWSADGRRIVTGGTDRTIRVWDAADASLLDTIDTGIKRVRDLAISPDGTRVAVVGLAPEVSIIDLRTRATSTLHGHRGNVSRAAWSPDGHGLATGDSTGEIHVWHVDRGVSRTLAGHGGEITGLAFTSDGELLLSAGRDRTLREWPITSSNGAPTIKSVDADELTCLSLSADGSWCAIGTNDGKVVLLRRPKTTRRVSPAPAAPPAAPAPVEVDEENDSSTPSPRTEAPTAGGESEAWETVEPSEAVPEAAEDLETFAELLDAIMEYAAVDIRIRQLVLMFGAKKRGSRVIAGIREAFEADGLGYSDAIEHADLDRYVRLFADGQPAAVVATMEE